jgi:hypothetical protein
VLGVLSLILLAVARYVLVAAVTPWLVLQVLVKAEQGKFMQAILFAAAAFFVIHIEDNIDLWGLRG